MKKVSKVEKGLNKGAAIALACGVAFLAIKCSGGGTSATFGQGEKSTSMTNGGGAGDNVAARAALLHELNKAGFYVEPGSCSDGSGDIGGIPGCLAYPSTGGGLAYDLVETPRGFRAYTEQGKPVCEGLVNPTPQQVESNCRATPSPSAQALGRTAAAVATGLVA